MSGYFTTPNYHYITLTLVAKKNNSLVKVACLMHFILRTNELACFTYYSIE